LAVWQAINATVGAGAILHEHGEGGVAVYQHVVPDDEDAAYHYDTSQPTSVTTYVPATPEGARRRAAIATALGHLTAFNLAAIGPVRTREVAEEDWANAWKEFYHPMRFGRRLVVKPSWRDVAAGPDDRVIVLDRGLVIADASTQEIKSKVAGKRVRFSTGALTDKDLAILEQVEKTAQEARRNEVEDVRAAYRRAVIAAGDVRLWQGKAAEARNAFSEALQSYQQALALLDPRPIRPNAIRRPAWPPNPISHG